MSSFWNTLRRWYSTVFGLRNSAPAMSRLRPPSATSRAIWSSCGVSWSSVAASRLRAVSPVARSSAAARSAHGAAPSASKRSSAARSCVRASVLRRARRRNSPYASSVRACTNGHGRRSCTARHSWKCASASSGPASSARARASTTSPTACPEWRVHRCQAARRRAPRRADRRARRPRRGRRSPCSGTSSGRRRRRPGGGAGHRPVDPAPRSSMGEGAARPPTRVALVARLGQRDRLGGARAARLLAAADGVHAGEQREHDRRDPGLAGLARQRERLGSRRLARRRTATRASSQVARLMRIAARARERAAARARAARPARRAAWPRRGPRRTPAAHARVQERQRVVRGRGQRDRALEHRERERRSRRRRRP